MKKHIRKVLCMFLGAIVLIFVLKIKFTYSKYIKCDEVKVNTSVAKPNFLFKSGKHVDIEYLNSNTYSYEFSVKNFDENLISEVNFKYNIIFELSQEKAPILINLYRKNNDDEEKVELLENQLLNLESFTLDKKQNDYRVEVFYDTNSKEVMEENFKINIVVQAVQDIV